MSYHSKRRWHWRMALGLALTSVLVAASVGSAETPRSYEQFSERKAGQVVPYLSHGMLTQEDADRTAANAQSGDDPYLSDVNVRPGESLGGPDGGPAVPRTTLQSQDAGAEAETPEDEQPEDDQTQRTWTDRD